jgi:hypothetical protein
VRAAHPGAATTGKDKEMNHTHNRKKTIAAALATAAAAVAAPAALFAGAGTAQADTYVWSEPNGLGTNVHIQNESNNDGWCTYTATPENSPLLPYVSLPFKLLAKQTYDLQTFGFPTGTGWVPSVTCDNGGSQVTSWNGMPTPITY